MSVHLKASRNVLFSVCLFGVLLLGGCATLPQDSAVQDANWPQGIPERAYFVEQFEGDKANQSAQSSREYLVWIVRFYEGWALYPKGWNWLTEEVVKSVDASEREWLIGKMYSIGERISAEWAKDRGHRHVNTNHLLVWGDALKIAVREGSQRDLALKISDDVDGLLAQRIQPDHIDLDRYLSGNAEVASEEVDDASAFDEPFSDPFEA